MNALHRFFWGFGLLSVVLLAQASMANAHPQSTEIILTASDGRSGDNFGRSARISGNVLIVGANDDENFDPDDEDGEGFLDDYGSVYLFDLTTGAEISRLEPSDRSLVDRFGWSLGIDGNTIVVGSRRGHMDNSDSSEPGSAYLFDLTTGAETILTPSDGAANDDYGMGVAISGNTAIVGAYRNDTNGTSTGAAYLYDTSTGVETFRLAPNDGQVGDQFGRSVAISGNTAIIGAFGDDDNGSFSGSAYLFDISTGQQTAKLIASNGAVRDEFGISVAISGNTAIVGTRSGDGNAVDSGAAYLYDITTGLEIAKLTASDGMAGDEFGLSVAIHGNTAVVGARNSDANGIDGYGAVYLFDVATGLEIAQLRASDVGGGPPFDRYLFGDSVSISGSTVIVGVHHANFSGGHSGAVYLYDISSGAGDLDFDDDTDGADFLRWQRGAGINYDSNDLAEWEANFGNGVALTAVVPEPSSWLALMLGLSILWFFRDSRRCNC